VGEDIYEKKMGEDIYEKKSGKNLCRCVVPFDANILERVRGAIAVVEKQLGARRNKLFGEDANAMVAVHHHNCYEHKITKVR
jgi:hypothetical protein